MKSLTPVALIAVLGLACGAAAQTKPDQREHEQLTRKLREARDSYADALEDVRNEMREKNGAISNTSSAELVYRREKLDHWRSRLTAHCAITGLPFPTFEPANRQVGTVPSGPSSDDVRAQARRLVLSSLRREAMARARQVRLPIRISMRRR